MAHLVYRGSSGIQHFSGSKYVNPELGTHRFCIRTGTGNNNVVKYGLTTQSSASKYCGFKFKVSGMDVYLGKYGDVADTKTISSTYTQKPIVSKTSSQTYSRTSTSKTGISGVTSVTNCTYTYLNFYRSLSSTYTISSKSETNTFSGICSKTTRTQTWSTYNGKWSYSGTKWYRSNTYATWSQTFRTESSLYYLGEPSDPNFDL